MSAQVKKSTWFNDSKITRGRIFCHTSDSCLCTEDVLEAITADQQGAEVPFKLTDK